jgi:hypothetical protein
MNHSDNLSAGNLWGAYWNDTDSDRSNDSCWYCHGDTKHNQTAMGRVDAARTGTNTVNGSIGATTTWCGSCHYNQSATYIGDQFTPRPPEIRDTSLSSKQPYFYNHAISSYNDSTCKNCHGKFSPVGMDAFMHNVGIGQRGGNNCTLCHYPGNTEASGRAVNFTAFQQSIHANLNNETSTPSGIPAYTAACWACHGDGSDPGDAHPENYSTPLSCAGGVGDCHVSGNPGYGRYNNAFRVTEHTASADSDSGIVTTMDCLTCHNRSIWNESNINDAVNSADDNVSHYGTKTYLKVGSANSATTDCIGCHKESQSESDRWYATYIDSPSSSHFKTGSNANTCYGCHTYPEATPQNFHDEKLRSVGWGGGCNQPGCHD